MRKNIEQVVKEFIEEPSPNTELDSSTETERNKREIKKDIRFEK